MSTEQANIGVSTMVRTVSETRLAVLEASLGILVDQLSVEDISVLLLFHNAKLPMSFVLFAYKRAYSRPVNEEYFPQIMDSLISSRLLIKSTSADSEDCYGLTNKGNKIVTLLHHRLNQFAKVFAS